MTKIRPYMILIVALLLTAGPWLQATETNSPSAEQYCDCCQGPCEGCCCSVAVPPAEKDSGAADDGCHCTISGLPTVPNVPMEFHKHRTDNKTDDVGPAVGSFDEHTFDVANRSLVTWHSPPPASSRPAYILFGALLI
ncbi:MAG: hypothetical protein JSV52_04475 [Candidatus Zixiibacteriota bacterium]|nr:MAG: hypothetical protein JSV52_04475 [candidate division Zixibacteria bacterium]